MPRKLTRKLSKKLSNRVRKSLKRNVRKSLKRNVRKTLKRNVRKTFKKKNIRKTLKRNVRKSLKRNVRKNVRGGGEKDLKKRMENMMEKWPMPKDVGGHYLKDTDEVDVHAWMDRDEHLKKLSAEVTSWREGEAPDMEYILDAYHGVDGSEHRDRGEIRYTEALNYLERMDPYYSRMHPQLPKIKTDPGGSDGPYGVTDAGGPTEVIENPTNEYFQYRSTHDDPPVDNRGRVLNEVGEQ